MNPASAGGRALKALPQVHEILDRLSATHRTVTTRSIDHAYEEAVGAAEAGETVVALGGDGLLRPLAGALKNTGSALAIVPCGRGNDLARMLGIPTDPGEAAAARRRGRRSGSWTWRTSRARRTWAWRASGSTRTPTGSPTRRSS